MLMSGIHRGVCLAAAAASSSSSSSSSWYGLRGARRCFYSSQGRNSSAPPTKPAATTGQATATKPTPSTTPRTTSTTQSTPPRSPTATAPTTTSTAPPTTAAAGTSPRPSLRTRLATMSLSAPDTDTAADGAAPSPAEVRQYLRETHERLFANNRAWAADKQRLDPGYFTRLAAGQAPDYLWIGCSDSRIPAEQITGLEPGEAFIHRNIANLVCNADLNCMSVINYAVRHLSVKHIVVCGHYGCGGVKAAMTPKDMGLLNPWLRNIRDVYRLHEAELDAVEDQEARYNRLVELNVEEQCRNVVKTAAVQQSYANNFFPVVHGWVFDFRNGLIKDLKIDFVAMLQNVQKIYNLVD